MIQTSELTATPTLPAPRLRVLTNTPAPSASPTRKPTTPVTETSATETPAPTFTLAPNPKAYIVQKGDSLWGISSRFKVPVGGLIAVNHLEGSSIQPGDVLLLPPIDTAEQDFQGKAGLYHRVVAGESLETIAAHAETDIQAIRAANTMYGDAILPGQWLRIPEGTLSSFPAWHYANYRDDLSFYYPASLEMGRFSLNFVPGTYPAVDPEAVARLVERSMAKIETLMGKPFPYHFAMYAAGALFEPPDLALRGNSRSKEREVIFLYDGSGDPSDLAYLAAHELTHLYTWNMWGQPAGAFLTEGTAVYSAMATIEGQERLSLEVFCSAFERAGELPLITENLTFGGQNIDLENYYTAGGFVLYLVKTYGLEPFSRLYTTSSFEKIYGKTLAELEQEWRTSLKQAPLPGDLAPAELVQAVRTFESAYRDFVPTFIGLPRQQQAYYELDQARLALLRLDLPEVYRRLEAERTILKK